MAADEFDIVIIGAGMAGASVAARLAPNARVLVIERESQPGYHSTGRSAALFSETYGNAPVRALSRASRSFLFTPPDGFTEYPLVHMRGSLHIARADQRELYEAFLAQPDVAANTRPVTASGALELCPILRPDYAVGAVFEPQASDVDVSALHQGFLRMLKAGGGRVVTDANVLALERGANSWRAKTVAGDFRAPIVVNAAGAWAGEIASLAGAAPLSIEPFRRTAVLIDAPGLDVGRFPNVIDIGEEFYFKPDAGRLLLSPADETPSPPSDVQPDEMDVAIAIDRMQRATILDIRRVFRKWAGLRSFAPDRTPIIGFDTRAEGFFWLAGQGGYGIQTAPAASLLAAALLLGRAIPGELAPFGVNPADVSPQRFS
jgi:D-arginine dehydrogenase